MSFIFDIFTQGSPDGTLGSTLAGIVENIPHTPSRIQELSLFTPDFLMGTGVDFDVEDMVLALVDPVARSASASQVAADPRAMVHFKASSFKRSARITEAEIRDLRKLGSAQFEAAKSAMARKLRKPVLEARAFREFQQLGAIKGIITDSAGNPISDIYTKMGKTKPEDTYLDLDNLVGDGDFNTLCSQIVDKIADELGEGNFDHVHCWLTSAQMQKIANLAECRETYRYQQGQAFLQARKGYGTVFTYGGVTFETYRGKFGGVDFLAADELVFFPVGAGNFYAGYAPSTRIVDPITGAEAEEGLLGSVEFYLPFIDPRGEFEEVEVQTHPVYVNLKPLSTIIARAGADPTP